MAEEGGAGGRGEEGEDNVWRNEERMLLTALSFQNVLLLVFLYSV